MTKKQLIEARQAEHKLAYGNYKIGPAHVFNAPPTNAEEAHQHGNALAASGNYPVGTSECFNVGISGGCGPECYIYLEGRCGEPQEMLPRLDAAGLALHSELYPENMKDMDSKGRRSTPPIFKGEAHGRAKLTSGDVFAIRERIAAGHVIRKIADDFGVSRGTVHHIKSGIVWAHTQPPTHQSH